MRKRILSLLLAFTLCLSLLPMTALAAESDFVIENGVLTRYTGPGGDVVIPEGVRVIWEGAFSGCDKLTSVVIPEGVQTIFNGAFENCGGLTSVVIPEGVVIIGNDAFRHCSNLRSVSIPSTVRAMGDSVFNLCENLTHVTIAEGVKHLGRFAFYGCSSLADIHLPDSLTEIGDAAFVGTAWAKKQTEEWVILRGYLLRYQGPGGKVTVPDGVVGIDGAFVKTNVTEVTIPEGVKRVSYGAFQNCPGLTSVTFPSSVQYIETGYYDIFYESDNIKEVHVPKGSYAEEVFKAYRVGHFAVINDVPPFTGTAYASNQSVLVDGEKVEFQMYALKDADGNPTNYVKVRDVAHVLNGTKSQFNVEWDGAVNLTAGKAYAPNGSEMKTPFSGNRAYTYPPAETKVNGQSVLLDAIYLADDDGGGYTYYKLRDLGSFLGFNVGWSDGGIYVETGKPYDPNN